MRIDGDIYEGLLTDAANTFKGQLTINSFGGNLNEGLAIYDYLNTLPEDKKEFSQVFGACMSAATFPLLAFSVRKGSENSRFLIHNPWTMAVGEAKDFRKIAEDMSKDEVAIVDIYEKHLNISRDEIIQMMAEEKYLTAREALDINLITEIIMTDTKKIEERLDKTESLLNKFMNEVKAMFKKPEIKNIVVQTDDGQELDFGEEITTEEQIVVGVTATADGSPANGEYQRTGMTYIFENGTLTEIREDSNEGDEAEDMETLQNEVNELKKKLEAAETQNSEIQKVVNTLKSGQTELKNLVSKISTDFTPETVSILEDLKAKNEVTIRMGRKRKE